MVSLVVSTLGRVQELDRLLTSLDKQTVTDFEVLIVDQNDDDRLDPILKGHPNLPIRHLRSGRGLSRGRNAGLPLAKGEIICFPDDDCWYPDDLLAVVEAWFADHPEFAVLFTRLRDADNKPVGPNSPEDACVVTRRNLWDIGISPCSFLLRRATDAIGLFDENIGVGADSQYQSGEETDYYLRVLEHGFSLWFEPSITVHHPKFHSLERLLRTTYPFALGAGYVTRIYGYPWWFLARRLNRSLGGAVVSLLKADIGNTKVYLLRAAGQLVGYVSGPLGKA